MKNNIWQLQEAKSKFSQLVENAMRNEPQIVTKHGNKNVADMQQSSVELLNPWEINA